MKKRIEALFLDNIGKIVTREMIIEVARDPNSGVNPENWHQRLSELRTNDGYEILSYRDRNWLKTGQYLMETSEKNERASSRVIIDPETWKEVLKRAGYSCQWKDGNTECGLKQGDTDPVGGGTVRLTPDHLTPHSVDPKIDPKDPNKWQALCGRHQIMKKNYWDDQTGKLNTYAIVQSASIDEKREIYRFLQQFFGDENTE